MNFVLPRFRESGTALSACFAPVASPTCPSAENKPKHAGVSAIVIQAAEACFQASTEIKEGVRVGGIVVADAEMSLHEGGEVSTAFADKADPAEQNSWL